MPWILGPIHIHAGALYAVSAMKLLGANAATNSVAVLGGAIVNLSMADVGVAPVVDWGNVTNLNVANGRVNLTGDIDVVICKFVGCFPLIKTAVIKG